MSNRVEKIDVPGVVPCLDECDFKVRETLWTTFDSFGEYAYNLYVCEKCGASEKRKGMFKHGVYKRPYWDYLD